jgi:hypothetical protein
VSIFLAVSAISVIWVDIKKVLPGIAAKDSITKKEVSQPPITWTDLTKVFRTFSLVFSFINCKSL